MKAHKLNQSTVIGELALAREPFVYIIIIRIYAAALSRKSSLTPGYESHRAELIPPRE